MNITDKAKEFAIKAHKGQIRKSEPEKPMVIHPINAGEILKEYGFDDNVIAAGYLHDVVEDTKYTIEDIEKLFGSDIASLVMGASESDKSLSWEERKKHETNDKETAVVFMCSNSTCGTAYWMCRGSFHFFGKRRGDDPDHGSERRGTDDRTRASF